jgi:quercetin dioxygenase-like cupin family protein
VSDTATHSTWDAYGLAVGGPLKGTQLKPLVLVPEFWFAWSEFHPRTGIFAVPQAGAQPVWETLKRAPVPPETGPNVSLVRLTPRATGALGTGHTHPGPVFGYVLRGVVENQVQPDPPATYRTGEVFSEAPGHLHTVMRSVNEAEPATVLAFLGGAEKSTNPAIPVLAEAALVTTASQEAILRRLALPVGARAAVDAAVNPGVVYVLEGEVEISGVTQPHAYAAGDVIVTSAHQRADILNRGNSAAKVLVFQLSGLRSVPRR